MAALAYSIFYVEDYDEKILNKFRVLISCVIPTVFKVIDTCSDYESGLDKLDAIFIKTANEILARYLLSNRKQEPNVNLVDFFRWLDKLRRNCN